MLYFNKRYISINPSNDITMKTNFVRFLLGISTILIFTNHVNHNKNNSKISDCTLALSFENQSDSTTISQITGTDAYQDYVINNLGAGQQQYIFGLSRNITICIRIGTSHAAGRIKFTDPYGTLISCIDIPANSNTPVCYDLTNLIMCVYSYHFEYKEVSCPN
jgi:hypothetical protein